MNALIFIIYLTGVILAYIVLKKTDAFEDQYWEGFTGRWKPTVDRLTLSLLSWAWLLIEFVKYIEQKIEGKGPKPPKWL